MMFAFSIASQSKIPPHEHAAIEKIIEDLSSQLSRIKEFAIEDEDEVGLYLFIFRF